MERVVDGTTGEQFKLKFKKLIARHVELMRCVDLLEIIFSKPLLLNAFTSSVIICVTGFNITANENIMIMATFASFLTHSLLQMYLYCNYGDNIMRSSMEVSDAIYNSEWYNIDAKERRNFLLVLIRAQKPSKISAYGFFDFNLMAYTSILSTSWSYFALLKTVYHPD
ncbi:odorant receptor 4-like [Anticarsia gemmatalis]|uniref:odorant receptor 4-like n=1 Tax=Anticarsia gemmatalis TaxID=129554 RepID=UPI003F76EC6D